MSGSRFNPVSGQLNSLLTYQTPAATPDALGQDTLVWADDSRHWANVRTPSGTESATALQMRAAVSHVVTTHHPGFTFDPKGRLVDNDGKVFNVVSSFDPDSRGRMVQTYVIEIIAPAGQVNP